MKRLTLVFLCLVLCASTPIVGVSAASAGDDIEDMIPAFDSIMRTMMCEEAQYDPQNPEFFWAAIYSMAVNFDYGDAAEIGYDDDACELLLPTLAVREMARALFAEYDGFLPIPDAVSHLVRYDAEFSGYCFPLSDAGDSYVKVDRYELSLSNFVFVVYASLVSYYEEETLLSAKFELMPDTGTDDIIIRYYPYNIVSAEIL